jgi:ATP-dependent RNA helicase RhlE
LKQFADLGLAEPLLRAVEAEGYSHPTPIQTEVIPAMLAKRDIVGIAQTGTGKTAAFVLPLLHTIHAAPAAPGPRSCRALILVPTRELAAQVADSIRAYGRFGRASTVVIVGGVKPGPQVRALAPGADIVVATPGRLEDHLRAGAVRLDRAGIVVLDEADRMLDLGFMPSIRRILRKVPSPRQTVLLSATMPKPIRELAREFLSDPKDIAVAPSARPIESIDQSVVLVDAAGKRDALVRLLAGPDIERAIVFTRTKRGADKVNQHLDRAGLSTVAIHGNKSQGQRERALADFRDGRVTILVATDIAARGIDVDGVSHVVNYELPNVPEAYVHRIGRTARAGRSGIAVSLCDTSERPYLRDIERLIGRRLPGNGEPSPAAAFRDRPTAAPRPQARPDRPRQGAPRPNGQHKGRGDRRWTAAKTHRGSTAGRTDGVRT